MKPQDIVFVGVVVALLLFRKPSATLITGLLFLVLAMPLFATWTFFTAQRFTWYAAVLFVGFCINQLVHEKGENAK